MQHYSDDVRVPRGVSVAGASVLVQLNGVNATIYSDNGVTQKANPLTTDANGTFDFYAANGTYTLIVTPANSTTSVTASATLFDANDLAAPTGSSLVGFTQSGTGAVARTVQDELRSIRVSVTQFGILGDGSDERAKVQEAIDATPTGGTLVFDFFGTITVDTSATNPLQSDAGSNHLYSGLVFNRPMRVIGFPECTVKLKNFSSGWQAQANTGADQVSTVTVCSSDVHIDGLIVNANGANHYETDGSGFLWWEEGPTLKRPPNGIVILAPYNQQNIENVLIENCKIYDPLSGIYFFGNVTGPNLTSFLSGSCTVGVVKNSLSRNNHVYNSRGNGVIFNIGVDGCDSVGDTFINCMYHSVRFYNNALNCRAINGRSVMICDQVIARYNNTDLGYWRTTKTADTTNFPIARQGFTIGSAHAYDVTSNVIGCSISGCKVYFLRMTNTAQESTYFTTGSRYFSGICAIGLDGSTLKGNEVYGHANGMVLYADPTAPSPAANGVVAEGNKIVESYIYDIIVDTVQYASITNNQVEISASNPSNSAWLTNCANCTFSANHFSGTPPAGVYAIEIAGTVTGLKVPRNTFTPAMLKIRRIVQDAGSTPLIPYAGLLVSPITNAKAISSGAYTNSWADISGVVAGSGNDTQIRIREDGTVQLLLRLSAAAATNSPIFTLMSALYPTDLISFIATDLTNGGQYWGRITTTGVVSINLPAYPSATLTQLYAEVSYSTL